MSWILVFLGGGLGSLCRYAISKLCLSYDGFFPLATLISNISASLLLAILVVVFYKKPDLIWLQPLLIIGFCGGFSTFSTFSLENVQLFQQAQYSWLVGNIFISLASCFMLLYAVLTFSK